MVKVPVGSAINIRKEPSSTSAVIMRFKTTQEVVRIGEEEDWVNIAFVNEKEGDYTEGWVYSAFVTEGVPYEEDLEDDYGDSAGEVVVINDTVTNRLNVREEPWGTTIDRVKAGETFNLMDETAEWFQIELNDGTLGWVSKEYASLEY
jgi:N-acetylmuramoyl-L-alanine amidase